MRRASRNDSVVAYSTIIRAERSVRLHTTAPSATTSPLRTPYGSAGRILSDVITAGAVVWPPATWRGPRAAVPPMAAAAARKLRLLTLDIIRARSDISFSFVAIGCDPRGLGVGYEGPHVH